MVPVPSLFFIGENGTPLEIIAGATNADDLISKINNVLTQAGKNNKNSSSNLIDMEQKAAGAGSSNNEPTVEPAECNTDNVNCNSNTDPVIFESTAADVSNNKDATEDSVKAITLSNIENKDNNEESQENSEIKQDTQNKELQQLTAEVSGIYINTTKNLYVIAQQYFIFIIHKFIGKSRESTEVNRTSTKTTIRRGNEEGTRT